MTWLVVAAVVLVALVVASQIWTSALCYRRTMRREWPKVEPRPDDED